MLLVSRQAGGNRQAAEGHEMTLRGKAAILDQPNGTFTIDEAEVPEPSPDGLLVRQEMPGAM